MDRKKTSSPSFGNNLNLSIHCYGHAIKVHAEQKQFGQAGNLCLELGVNLMKLCRNYEAVEYFDKASKFYKNQPVNEIHSLEWLCMAQVTNGELHAALKTLEFLKILALSCCDDKLKPTGVFRKYLSDAEIVQILLISAVGPQKPQRLSQDEMNLRQKYVTIVDVVVDTYLDLDCFALLQNFILAVDENDYESCDVCLSNLRPFLKPFMLDLGIEIVKSVKNYEMCD